MAAGKWQIYESAKRYMLNGGLDLDAANFYCAIFKSTSNAYTLGGGVDLLADLTNECDTGGYVAGGVPCGTGVLTGTGTVIFGPDTDPEWDVTGTPMVGHFAVIYLKQNAPVVDPLLAVCYLDYNGGSPQDVTTSVGNTLTVDLQQNQVLALSGGTGQ